jgi:hypothetical protein
MKLSDLLRQRSALAQQSAELAERAGAVSSELERIDAELFARMKNLVTAIEGDDEPSAETSPAPTQAAPPRVDVTSQAIANLFSTTYKLRARRQRSQLGLEPHIVSALGAAGRPLTRNELYDLMVSRGVDVPGKDPRANLSAHLSYSQKVTRTPEGLWALAKAREVQQSG